jgi:hypothetical protein
MGRHRREQGRGRSRRQQMCTHRPAPAAEFLNAVALPTLAYAGSEPTVLGYATTIIFQLWLSRNIWREFSYGS